MMKISSFVLLNLVRYILSQDGGENPGQCQDIMVPMCRGLVGYTKTRLPNQAGHQTQAQAYRALDHLWSFMDLGCSANFRIMACGFFLPRCTEESPDVELPCRETCMKAKKGCASVMRQYQSRWPAAFRCGRLRRKRQGNCISHVREQQSDDASHVFCVDNSIPMCANLTFNSGSLPNMFLQRSQQAIETETEQYWPLVRTQCSAQLAFFICGTYMPFCIRTEEPFAMPCRELCEQVFSECQHAYVNMYGDIPWPSKFQCHRFPESSDALRRCVNWNDQHLTPNSEHVEHEETIEE